MQTQNMASPSTGVNTKMTTLQNFPLKNQRTTTLPDGTLDLNNQFDCVPEVLAAALEYLTGKSYEGGQIKEAVYGASYQGTTDAAQYVNYCSLQGVELSYFQAASNIALVNEAHIQLQQGHPVVFSEPDPYCTAEQRDVEGWTHVCVWYGETADGSGLIAMDPFGGFSIARPDADWASLLRYGQIWILQKKKEGDEMPTAISLSNPTVAAYYEQAGDMWRCITPGVSHGLVIGNAILTYYQQEAEGPLRGVTSLGLPISNEISIGNGRVKQHFERGVLIYDPAHSNDNPPGASSVYRAHLYTGVGQDPRVADLTRQLTTLKAAPPVQLASDAAKISKLTSGLNQIQSIVKESLV